MSEQKSYWLDFNYADCAEEYLPALIGPDGFVCVLTEPEDRNFNRDANDLVVELNRLADRLEIEDTVRKFITDILDSGESPATLFDAFQEQLESDGMAFDACPLCNLYGDHTHTL